MAAQPGRCCSGSASCSLLWARSAPSSKIDPPRRSQMRSTSTSTGWPPTGWSKASRCTTVQHRAPRREPTTCIPHAEHFSDGPFTSYIGTPAVALLHVPLLLADRDTALWLFRLFALIGMVAAIVVTANALGAQPRVPAAVVGIGALLLFSGTVRTLDLGQGHEVVMLGLAIGIWATARERWALAGIGLGVATVLKLSPVLLVVYLLLNRKWKAVGWAAGTTVLLNVLAAAVGRPGDLWCGSPRSHRVRRRGPATSTTRPRRRGSPACSMALRTRSRARGTRTVALRRDPVRGRRHASACGGHDAIAPSPPSISAC